MNKEKQEWDKHLTPKLGISDVMQRALDWWHELPIQNLQDMNDSWVGYLWKYYPDKSHPYHLTGEEVQHIYENEHAENLNISDVSDSFVRGQFYTKHYKNGDKMIFKYKGKSTDKDMIKVYMFCGNDGEEYGEDTEVTISKSGTGEGSYIEKSTKEDIEFLNSISQNYH